MKDRIRDYHEETDCDNCGCPLYSGDTVHVSDSDWTLVACSTHCLQELQPRLAYNININTRSPNRRA